MIVTRADGSVQHLSYCSNIHPAESWAEVRSNLHKHVLPIQALLVGTEAFGIGLRLSALAAKELAQPQAMAEFKEFLANHNCYVFTINGFPYGPFHGTRVKEDVYLPDWMDEERLTYTNQLATVFAEFLPPNQTGSISTVPGAFKDRVTDKNAVAQMASQMVKHVAHLYELEQDTGASIILALEPEPCCFLETIEESIAFFTDHLFSSQSVEQLQALLNIDSNTASALLQKHITLCLDTCHAAVEFENAESILSKLKQANINIGKVQISAGLRIKNVTSGTIESLQPFIDKVYLHQVVERHNGELHRYTDLPEAIAQLNEAKAGNLPREWRIHFHVPIFLDELEQSAETQFFTTQDFIKDILAIHNQSPISDHLEVETYTWDVLPEHCKTDQIDDAIVRELNWTKNELTNTSESDTATQAIKLQAIT